MPARADTVRQSSATDRNCSHRGGVGREEEPEDSGSSFGLARWLFENREEQIWDWFAGPLYFVEAHQRKWSNRLFKEHKIDSTE